MTNERILDSDTHCIETPDVWTSRLPKAWGDQVMHMRYDKELKRDMWYVGNEAVNKGWRNASYGTTAKTRAERRDPATVDDVHPLCFDPKERIKVMDEWGIESAVLYPNGSGFALQPFLNLGQSEIAQAHLSAYNDFLLEEWVNPFPGRFIPMAVVSYWDIPGAVNEIERIADKGFGGIVTTGAPQVHGQPYLRDRSWDPYWAAAEAAGLPFAFHVANGDPEVHTASDLLALEPVDVSEARIQIDICLDNAMQCTDLLLSGILARFPKLKFVISESGVGWVPFMLEGVDERFKRQNVRLPEFCGLLPSELFHRQVYVNTFFEHVEEWHVEKIGANNIMFQTDIPHPTGWYSSHTNESAIGNFKDDALEVTAGALGPESRHRVLWQNGADLYKDCLEKQNVTV